MFLIDIVYNHTEDDLIEIKTFEQLLLYKF